jgi:putative ATP-dependent endonuclease of the OLD family
MHIESLSLTNFRCFGPLTTLIPMEQDFTAFVGDNGAGKTAVMQALLRLFSISQEQRRLRRQDFHVPWKEEQPPTERQLAIEAILALPELQAEDGDHSAVPEFFNQMSVDEQGHLKCRIRLEARWIADGSVDGSIDFKLRVIRTLGDFSEEDCVDLRANDRLRIQMIYVPASRDGASQLATFLRGRLWKAVAWSEDMRTTVKSAGQSLQTEFAKQPAVATLTGTLVSRWQQLNAAGTELMPCFSPIDTRFEEFVRNVSVVFAPDEHGTIRPLEDLSDGQRSLFHLAMTAATLDVESEIVAGKVVGFQTEDLGIPALTMIALEEPENSLAPFYLSRIVDQIKQLTGGLRAQAFLSSHSSSILARVEPHQIRHLRLEPKSRTVTANCIRMPEDDEEVAKFLKQAVRAYPELYFAKCVVLGEGASEEIIFPRLAASLGFYIDPSFVAIVPLGGRHVNHLWKLLTDLAIPYVTLLDLDWGRHGGGWGRIKTACEQLLENGVSMTDLFGQTYTKAQLKSTLTALATRDPLATTGTDGMNAWLTHLQKWKIYFASPLDIDYAMLKAFPIAYRTLGPGMEGPDSTDPRPAVLGDKGRHDLYTNELEQLSWYRYLFLGRGKPSTHMRALNLIADTDLANQMPGECKSLVQLVQSLTAKAASSGKG